MTALTILLLAISVAVLGLGAWLHTLTSSRSVVVNVLFGSFMLLYAAYQATAREQPQWIFVLPFFATMLFAGRAAAWWWRTRREAELREPARVLTAVTALSLMATISAYVAG